MQGKVLTSGNRFASQYSLILSPGFKPLQCLRTMASRPACDSMKLDGQTFTAFGTAGSDYCAASAGFHSGEKAVGTCALNFRWLVCAFHDQSYWLEIFPCMILVSLVAVRYCQRYKVRRVCTPARANPL